MSRWSAALWRCIPVTADRLFLCSDWMLIKHFVLPHCVFTCHSDTCLPIRMQNGSKSDWWPIGRIANGFTLQLWRHCKDLCAFVWQVWLNILALHFSWVPSCAVFTCKTKTVRLFFFFFLSYINQSHLGYYFKSLKCPALIFIFIFWKCNFNHIHGVRSLLWNGCICAQCSLAFCSTPCPGWGIWARRACLHV